MKIKTKIVTTMKLTLSTDDMMLLATALEFSLKINDKLTPSPANQEVWMFARNLQKELELQLNKNPFSESVKS